MLTTADFKKGLHILIDADPYQIMEYTVHSPSARGSATLVRTKVRNIKTDQVFDKTFKSGERFPTPDLDRRDVQFLYADGDDLHFMDMESYDQFQMKREEMGAPGRWLVDGLTLTSILFNGNIISVELPQFVEMLVTQADPGSRGDTAAGRVLKEAQVASGATVRVPLYLESGEKILVDTRTGEFVKRVKS